jgi:hypothetical protein
MRRYYQGTLDFACGVYAVINTLSRTHEIDLAEARRLFAEAQEAIAARPELFSLFIHNATDHYWVVRFMLAHVLATRPYALECFQPFSEALRLWGTPDDILDEAGERPYLPERESPEGPTALEASRLEAEQVWRSLALWLGERAAEREKRAAILRFHRFLPHYPHPVVSHWTTARALLGETIALHDASSEPGALLELEKAVLLPQGKERSLVRIVPESLLFIRRMD